MTVPGPFSPLPNSLELRADRVQLGRALFRDPRLSGDGSVSCASCHDVARGGADPGVRYSTGVAGRQAAVNTPTVLNAGFNSTQFWDGRVRTVEEQIVATLRDPVEMDSDPAAVAQRLQQDPSLRDAFRNAYGHPIDADSVVNALATYVRALITPDSPFDRFLRGDVLAMNADAREGHQLFVQLGCVSCHQGRNLGGNLFQHFGVMGDYFADRGEVVQADYGRFNVTGRERDRFRFKVPTLRNVADRPPYFHDGSAETLEDAVHLMVRYQLGRNADDGEIRKLIAFLHSLSGSVAEELR